MLRTYQPKKRQRKKEHGFRKEWLPQTAARSSLAAEQRQSKAERLIWQLRAGEKQINFLGQLS